MNELTLTTDSLSRAQQIFDMLDINEVTRENYKRNIRHFVFFLKGKVFGINTFIEYKRYLAELNFEVSTKNNYFHAAKIVLKELNRQGIVPADITQNVKCFKQEKGHKRFGLNEKDVQRVCQELNNMEDLRMKAIFVLLIFQGLRQKELVAMDVDDVDIKNMTARITGKGRQDYEVINLHPESVSVLKRYFETNPSGPLITSSGNRNNGERISTRQLRRIVKDFLTGLQVS